MRILFQKTVLISEEFSEIFRSRFREERQDKAAESCIDMKRQVILFCNGGEISDRIDVSELGRPCDSDKTDRILIDQRTNGCRIGSEKRIDAGSPDLNAGKPAGFFKRKVSGSRNDEIQSCRIRVTAVRRSGTGKTLFFQELIFHVINSFDIGFRRTCRHVSAGCFRKRMTEQFRTISDDFFFKKVRTLKKSGISQIGKNEHIMRFDSSRMRNGTHGTHDFSEIRIQA